MTLVNETLYSHNAVIQYVDRSPRYSEKRKKKRFSGMATVTDNSYNMLHDKSIKIASKAKVCPMSNENHGIKDCTYNLQQTMEEKIVFLFKINVCYGSL